MGGGGGDPSCYTDNERATSKQQIVKRSFAEPDKPERSNRLPATRPDVDLPPPYNKSFGGYMWDMVGKPAVFLVVMYCVLRLELVREQIGVVLKWLLMNL